MPPSTALSLWSMLARRPALTGSCPSICVISRKSEPLPHSCQRRVAAGVLQNGDMLADVTLWDLP